MQTVEAHVGKMEAELKAWGARLDKLIAKADADGTAAKIDYRKRLDDLKAKYRTAETRLEELKTAGSGKWEIFQSGLEKAWSELEIAFTKLTN
jgi:hypothetical protein